MLPSLFTIVLACTTPCLPVCLGAHALQKRMEPAITAARPHEALSPTADRITPLSDVPEIESSVLRTSEPPTTDAPHQILEPTVPPENILPIHESPRPRLRQKLKSRVSKLGERLSGFLRPLTFKNDSRKPSRPSFVMETLKKEFRALLHTLDSPTTKNDDKNLAEKIAHQCLANDEEMRKYLRPRMIQNLKQQASEVSNESGDTPQGVLLATIITTYLDGVRQSLKTALKSEEDFTRIELSLAEFISNEHDTFETVARRMANEKAKTLARDQRTLQALLGTNSHLAKFHGLFGPEMIQAPRFDSQQEQVRIAAQEWGMSIDQIKVFLEVATQLRDPFAQILRDNDWMQKAIAAGDMYTRDIKSTLLTIDQLEKRLESSFPAKGEVEKSVDELGRPLGNSSPTAKEVEKFSLEHNFQAIGKAESSTVQLERMAQNSLQVKEDVKKFTKSIKKTPRYTNLQIEVKDPVNSFGFALQLLEPFGIGRSKMKDRVTSTSSPHWKYGLKVSPEALNVINEMSQVAYKACGPYYGLAIQSEKARHDLMENIFTEEGLELFHWAINEAYRIPDQPLKPQVLDQGSVHEMKEVGDHKDLEQRT